MTGKQLRKIRGLMGLTQGQLAQRLKTTLNTIARWERDEIGISEPIALLVGYVAREAGVERHRQRPADPSRHASTGLERASDLRVHAHEQQNLKKNSKRRGSKKA